MPDTQKIAEKLTNAYKQFVEYTKEFLDESKEEAAPALKEAAEKSKEKLSELAELTVEEIDKVSDYVARDVHDAAEYIAEGERELGDWLRLDALYLEDKFMEAFSQMVDQTSLALKEIEERAKQATELHTGEVTAPGTLVCKACGEELHFKKPGHIPPCPKCHATVFERKTD